MCGRFAVSQPRFAKIEKELNTTFGDVRPRYNISPSQAISVIRAACGNYVMENMKWGLVPFWASGPNNGYSTFNARVETVSEKPFFRSAFQKRRCLIPASGFYEWKKVDRRKFPYYFSLASGEEMAFAGIWEEWRGNDGTVLHSCAIIVGEANPLVGGVHDRMACIVPPEAYEDWLNPSETTEYALSMLQHPLDADLMEYWPVSTAVNSVKCDGPQLIEPIE